ncbi:MAG TPA: efflux RND transporter permease subunit, partial [Steroidobacteraceae bacterium]
LGESPEIAAERGGKEVALPVLAATLTTAIVFFPVTFLYGVSRFLFTALALAVVLSLFASYFVAMTVVPLFCAKFIKTVHHGSAPEGAGDSALVEHDHMSWGLRFNRWFNRQFTRMLDRYEATLGLALLRPLATVLGITGIFIVSLALYPLVGKSYFPRTDPAQFVINLKAPSGSRLEITDQIVDQVEQIVRDTVPRGELKIIVSNIGTTPGFSSMYTSNSGPHTAFVQVGLTDDHTLSSFQYMDLVRKRLRERMPRVAAYFQTGGLVDAVLNLGLPAPLDIQVSGTNMEAAHRVAMEIARRARGLTDVSDVLVPQDIDYPSLKLDIDRVRASELGLNEKEVVGNVITALTSNGMIAPSYWVDPKSGNDYLLTVQYPENLIHNFADLTAVPLRGDHSDRATQLDTVSRLRHIETPTEVDHYQLRREMDVYVAPSEEDLSGVLGQVQDIIHGTKLPEGVRVTVRGSAQAMQTSFSAFGFGLILATLLVYLILVAQFQSFVDPLLILLAVPTGLTGVLLILFLTGTTLNVMSLMGVVMMVGIVVSNSILIVEFTHRLRQEGRSLREAVSLACRVRLRPVLMTSLATLIGLIPMALKLGTGSEAYAPLARAIIGGLAVSVVLTVFIVPAMYYVVHRKDEMTPGTRDGASSGMDAGSAA